MSGSIWNVSEPSNFGAGAIGAGPFARPIVTDAQSAFHDVAGLEVHKNDRIARTEHRLVHRSLDVQTRQGDGVDQVLELVFLAVVAVEIVNVGLVATDARKLQRVGCSLVVGARRPLWHHRPEPAACLFGSIVPSSPPPQPAPAADSENHRPLPETFLNVGESTHQRNLRQC